MGHQLGISLCLNCSKFKHMNVHRTLSAAGRLDLSRVAVMGHSWGGATAMLAASEHAGFKAGVCLDPWW